MHVSLERYPTSSTDESDWNGAVSTCPHRAQGHLTVVLDLDGTLVSSYTPARAPRLPAGMNTYIVGRGARMNPNGVFVVERPGLTHFFQQLSSFAGAQTYLLVL